MVRGERIVDIADQPDLLKVLEQVEASGEPARIERDGRAIARIVPAAKPRRRRATNTEKTLTSIIGIGQSAEPGDIATHKHDYIADAIESHFRSS